jgi:hypothetical protein
MVAIYDFGSSDISHRPGLTRRQRSRRVVQQELELFPTVRFPQLLQTENYFALNDTEQQSRDRSA